MKKEPTSAERLIVAADYRPEGPKGLIDANRKVLDLARSIANTGVHIKVNTVLRARGYHLIEQLHELGLKVFADPKLNDIKETLATDGAFLREVKPELLTVMCSAGIDGMRALKEMLPDTEVLGVTVLTSLDDRASEAIYRRTVADQVDVFARMALAAGLDGLIASGTDAARLRAIVGDRMTINTPAIRPTWANDPGDQAASRVMTPAAAIRAGADRIVVGRPIVQADDPHEAVMRTIREIESALA